MKVLFIILSLTTLVSCTVPGSVTWPNGIIPFVPVGLDRDEIKKLFEAMYFWETASMGRIQFQMDIPAGFSSTNTLYIVKNKILSGALGTGYFPGEINVLLLESFEQRAILHELGHKLGLEHEHQRPDRDAYITIDWNKVKIVYLEQFIYIKPELYDYAKYPYDYISVMHYSAEDTSAIDSHGHVIGASTISIIDALKVQDMYERHGMSD
jgi:hypothetical protein